MLTVTHGGIARPADRVDIDGWIDASRMFHRERQVGREDEVGAFLGLSDLMFGELGLEPLDLIEDGGWTEAGPVAACNAETQAELAGRALATLSEQMGAEALGKCRAIIYLTSSVDRAFFKSSVVQLAAAHGMHRVPHWVIGQLQGASLPVALDIADSLLSEGGSKDAGVLLIAAEAWPMPTPRAMAGTTVLCDGAVALWVSGDEAASGLRICASESRSFDPFVSVTDHAISVDEAAMMQAATSTVAETLEGAGLSAADVAMRHSEVRPAFDDALCAHLGIVQSLVAADNSGEQWAGWACAAASPRQLAEMLAMPQEKAEAKPVLVWNVSLAGGVGAVLLNRVGMQGLA
jgi:hypothetical protein